MKSSELRNAFLKYFERQGHIRVPSSSLVPHNDPTLLFTNAGMNQFKDCFLGADKRSYNRAATCQKVMRIAGKHNDFENVGVTARHHTFFEMLGNFSFGDYFKADAIRFGWEFVTKELGLPKERLWVTIYEEDDEAAKLWVDLTGIAKERVVRMGEADNFWAMGETGPCGPCTEIHVYRDADLKGQSEARLRSDDGSFLEIWNLVFMQFNRAQGGVLTPLPKPSVDTGMGLERVTSVIQNTQSNYDTDLLRGIIGVCENRSGFKYDGTSYALRDLRSDKQYARDVAMRVIADHSRAATFIIADGVVPGSEGRNYILRRLIRRAIRHGRVLEFGEPFMAHTCAHVIQTMGEHYPELREQQDTVLRVVEAEERKFYETLDAGMGILQKEVEKLKGKELFPGKTAFLLHDTYGFPLDLTEDALKAYTRKVDTKEFEHEMELQRQRSRDDRKAQAITYTSVKIEAPKTTFLGYEELEDESKLSFIVPREDGGNKASLIFEATPFYAESGGQVGDTGQITFSGVKCRVLDTQKLQDNYIVHECVIEEGSLSPKLVGNKASLKVDSERRAKIRAHHSATHLVHSGLRKILGPHVKQAGSRVDDERLRFDYSHFDTVTPAQLEEIQHFVNEEIRLNHGVQTRVMNVEEAKKTGAMALFGEKYGDKVRVVEIGPRSLELCGGTHVSRSGDIGFLMLSHESSIAAGVRRIECFAGKSAEAELLRERQELRQIAELLKTDPTRLPDKVEKVLQRSRALERELESMKSKLASAASGDLLKSARTSPKGVKVISLKVDAQDQDSLRTLVDRLRQGLGSGVVALGCSQGEGALLVAGVTSDLTAQVHAGDLVKEIVKMSGGRGGGRADFAQAGGLAPEKLDAALNKVFDLVA